jgi:methyl-accepting chemotaxis protein
MTIGRKIAAACGVLVLFSALIGAVAVWSIRQIREQLSSVVEDSLPGVQVIGRLDSLQLDLRGATLHHVATPDPKVKAKEDAQSEALKKQGPGLLKEYEETIHKTRDRELFQGIPELLESYERACEKVRALSREGKSTEAMAVYDTEGTETRNQLKTALNEQIEYKKASANENAKSAESAASLGLLFTGCVLSLSVLCGGILGFYIVRGINNALRLTIQQLGQGAAELKNAAAQVSSASQTLAQGSSEQAASIEETSAATAEITAMSERGMQNLASAAAMMQETDRNATEANLTLDRMVTSMSEITASSQNISKINRVIDGIAFQTNILALNAAVEAARAGESGMGFAVVADEVRTLAQRSAEAARNTAGLIEQSIGKSAEGRQNLDRVATAIQGLTGNTRKVRSLVDEVNTGAKEQTAGIQQISRAVMQIETVTQTTAAAAEESASASEQLHAQAESLNTIVQELEALVGAAA